MGSAPPVHGDHRVINSSRENKLQFRHNIAKSVTNQQRVPKSEYLNSIRLLCLINIDWQWHRRWLPSAMLQTGKFMCNWTAIILVKQLCLEESSNCVLCATHLGYTYLLKLVWLHYSVLLVQSQTTEARFFCWSKAKAIRVVTTHA